MSKDNIVNESVNSKNEIPENLLSPFYRVT